MERRSPEGGRWYTGVLGVELQEIGDGEDNSLLFNL